jgi:hypothetical protein
VKHHHREYDGETTVSLPFPKPDGAFIAKVRAIYRGFLERQVLAAMDELEVAAEQEADAYLARLVAKIRIADHPCEQNPDGIEPLPESYFIGGDKMGKEV